MLKLPSPSTDETDMHLPESFSSERLVQLPAQSPEYRATMRTRKHRILKVGNNTSQGRGGGDVGADPEREGNCR